MTCISVLESKDVFSQGPWEYIKFNAACFTGSIRTASGGATIRHSHSAISCPQKMADANSREFLFAS